MIEKFLKFANHDPCICISISQMIFKLEVIFSFFHTVYEKLACFWRRNAVLEGRSFN